MIIVTSKHVVLLYCNGACCVYKGYIKKKHARAHAHTHTHTQNTAKMADTDKSHAENVFNKLLDITEKSGNPRKDLRQDIIDSVSTLRSIFVNLRNSGEEKTTKINQLSRELNKAKTELMEIREANLSRGSLPSTGGKGQIIATAHNQLIPSGGPKKNCIPRRSVREKKRDTNSW